MTLSPLMHEKEEEEEEEKKEGLFTAAVNDVEEKEVISEVITVNEVEEEEEVTLLMFQPALPMFQPALPIRCYVRHELKIHSHGAEEEEKEEEEAISRSVHPPCAPAPAGTWILPQHVPPPPPPPLDPVCRLEGPSS